jgi:hypothetical protein
MTDDKTIADDQTERRELLTSVGMLLNLDMDANKHVEIVIGTDRVMRINIDGVCAMRSRIGDGCELVIRNDLGMALDL